METEAAKKAREIRMSDFCEMAEELRRRSPGVDETITLYGDTIRHANVPRQPHYAYGIQPIEYMESRFTAEQFRGWLMGNVLKYVSRYTRKDGVTDLLKAQDYLARLIAFEERQERAP